MKELATEFEGRGEMRGFSFRQIRANNCGYIYSVKSAEGTTHYEVFKRMENTQFNCVSYPKSGSFGVWAWCVVKLDAALEKFDEISNK